MVFNPADIMRFQRNDEDYTYLILQYLSGDANWGYIYKAINMTHGTIITMGVLVKDLKYWKKVA